MCGPSGEETLAQQQEAGLSQMLKQAYSDRFQSQTATLAELNTQLQQLATGQTPGGFDAATMATLQTKNIIQNAAATRSAQQAVSDAIAGQGGGAANPAGLVSGVQAAVRGDIAAKGAANLATEQENIQLENQAIGRQNLIASISGNEALAGIQNPIPFAGGASTANEAAFGEAKTINQQRNQASADIVGAITGFGGTALKAGMSLLGGGGGGNADVSGVQEDIAAEQLG